MWLSYQQDSCHGTCAILPCECNLFMILQTINIVLCDNGNTYYIYVTEKNPLNTGTFFTSCTATRTCQIHSGILVYNIH